MPGRHRARQGLPPGIDTRNQRAAFYKPQGDPNQDWRRDRPKEGDTSSQAPPTSTFRPTPIEGVSPVHPSTESFTKAAEAQGIEIFGLTPNTGQKDDKPEPEASTQPTIDDSNKDNTGNNQ